MRADRQPSPVVSLTDWPVSPGVRWFYITLVAGQLAGGSAIWCWYNWSWRLPVLPALIQFFVVFGSLVAAALMLAFVVAEGGGKIVVVVSRYFAERRQKEAQARAKGRAEVYQEVDAWRRDELANGGDFDTPPWRDQERFFQQYQDRKDRSAFVNSFITRNRAGE